MTNINLSETYERAAEDVFAVLIDIPNYPRWQPGVAQARAASSGTLRPGAQIKEVRRMLGRQAEVVLTLTEYAYPRRMAFDATAGATKARFAVTCKPVWGGTQLLLEGEVHPGGLAQQFEPLFLRALLSQLRGALRGLDRVVKALPASTG
jgi:hypothetical protein